MASLSSLQPPTPFNFSKPEAWTKWKRQFEQYRFASGLADETGARQASALLYCLGEGAEDVLDTTGISDRDKNKYEVVLAKFDAHFAVTKNVIFERARFNKRKQEKGESIELFITDVHQFAESCEFGTLKNELIRDRIVVGIQDTLSERLQMEPNLTLDKAKRIIRQRDAVREQGTVLKGTIKEEALLEGIQPGDRNNRKQFSRWRQPPQKQTPSRRHTHDSSCGRCGRESHPFQHCPARYATCFMCNRRGHFGIHCRSQTVAEVAEEMQSHPNNAEEFLDTAYLSTVSESSNASWTTEVLIQTQPVVFKVDTGAEVTAASEDTWKSLRGTPKLLKPTRSLCRPDHKPLQVRGTASVTLSLKQKSCSHTVYVVNNLTNNLLGLPAIRPLGLIQHMGTINSRVAEHYTDLFTGLGTFKGPEYSIKLNPDAKPFALHAIRNIPIPLQEATKKELERMELLGVISKVSEPTEWCAGMVVVPKESGKVRVCVDLRKLNESVEREVYPLPTVDSTLAHLTVFSKLDTNSGFWQVPLSPESRPLTTFITSTGRYCFNKLPFRLSSASEHFQKCMNELLADIPGVVCQIDDILIFANNQEVHNQRLDAVLSRLRSKDLTLNGSK